MEAKEIKKKVYEQYGSGYHCAEAISKTILEAFSQKPHSEAVKAASGFAGGIAASKEDLCGAFTGGVIALGCLAGRENPGENLKDCGDLTKEFKKQFLNEFGSTNCQTLLDGFNEKDNAMGCVKLTANAAVILSDLLKEFEKKKHTNFDNYACRTKDKMELGQCPFGDCSCSAQPAEQG